MYKIQCKVVKEDIVDKTSARVRLQDEHSASCEYAFWIP